MANFNSKIINLAIFLPQWYDGWKTCGVESAQGHAGSSNISETWAGTFSKLKEHGYV